MKAFPRLTFWTMLSVAAALGIAGCKSSQTPANQNTATTQGQPQDPSQDPAMANVAPISNTTTEAPNDGTYDPNAPTSGQYSAPSTGQSTPPQRRSTRSSSDRNPDDQGYNSDQYGSDNYDSGSYQPVEYAQQPPPALPQYDQPPCPGDGYIWTPGYWNYASDGYYWVPGAWVSAPYQGALWTPGYWGYDRGRYGLHRGYWGRHIGYYGGINYGFGYVGSGYQGGYWNGDRFDYNRSVNNVNPQVVHNVYNYTVINNTTTINRVSYNGPGGVQVQPRPAEIAALHEQHTPPMTAQVQHAQAAQANRGNFAAVNNGKPAVVAVSQPLPADHNIRPPAPVPMRNTAAQQPLNPQQQQRGPA